MKRGFPLFFFVSLSRIHLTIGNLKVYYFLRGNFPSFFVLKKIDKKLINILHGDNFIVYL